MTILIIALIVILFSTLVLIHEWGHFIMAKRNGVEVEEFALFFGPPVFKMKTKDGWYFKINLIPLGGYVKLKGEHDTDTGKGTYGAAGLWSKSKILAAGVVMNLVLGIVLLTAVALVGMPQLVPNQFTVKSDTKVIRDDVIISYVESGSPAAKAGLKAGDKLTAIGIPGTRLTSLQGAAKLPAITKQYAGKRVDITYERSGKRHHTEATLLTRDVVAASKKTDNQKGYLGIAPNSYTLQRSTWSAPVVAVGLTGQITALTFEGLGKAIAGLGSIIAGSVTDNSAARHNGQTAASEQVSGPIGIYYILKEGVALGYQFVLMVTAVISLSLGIINILPFPGLDGGRLWLTLYMRGLLKKPLSPGREELINAAGIIVLLGLMVLISIVDVKRS